MKVLFAAIALLPATAADATVTFDFVARHYFPAGYQEGTTSGVPDQYGFGFGALERSFYDADQQLFYGGSEIGFVTISDFANWPEVEVLDISFPLPDKLTDIKVCGDYLFYTTKDDPNPGKLSIYRKAVRMDDGSFTAPTLIQEIEVGVGPDNIATSKDCMTVATADEGEGDYDEEFINPVGTVSIVRGPFDDPSSPPTNTRVSLNMWTDQELLDKGVFMSIDYNGMQYWSSALGLNFSSVLGSYSSDMGLEPEYLKFSADESRLFVNLQENNAVVVVDVANSVAIDIFGYGLKTGVPTDILEDGGCDNMPVTEGLYFLRMADAIAAFEKDGVQYIITANEGDDAEYGDFEEKVDGEDIFDGSSILFPNMTADPSIFDPADPTAGVSAFFNAACDAAVTEYCSPGLAFSLGTATVDYSNPAAPNIYRLTGIGGRGISIYSIDDAGLELVWDSGDQFEREGCVHCPWAHNSVTDEEFAPLGGPFYNSLDLDDGLREDIEDLNNPAEDGCADAGDGNPGACPMSELIDDRSTSDGCAPEAVVVGEACDSMFVVTVCEKNSMGFVYELADVTSPALVTVFHLSTASETLSPGVAYASRSLGEIDSETIQFLTAEESPTGKAAVLFSGAFSGTTSLWEFNCVEEDPSSASTPALVGPLVAAAVSSMFYLWGVM